MEKIIYHLVDACNSHDAEGVAALYSEDYVGQDVAESHLQYGQPGIRHSVGLYLSAFPDVKLTAEEIIRQDGRAALVWSARGTHLGPLLNIPATGRLVVIRGVSVLTIVNNKISRALYVWDLAGLLRELALLPEL